MGFAETPDGGITSSGRNGLFHGPGLCNCRAVVRSHDGGAPHDSRWNFRAAFSKGSSATILRTGSTFNQTLDFDPVLVSPECSATMVNGGEPGAIFHANPVAN